MATTRKRTRSSVKDGGAAVKKEGEGVVNDSETDVTEQQNNNEEDQAVEEAEKGKDVIAEENAVGEDDETVPPPSKIAKSSSSGGSNGEDEQTMVDVVTPAGVAENGGNGDGVGASEVAEQGRGNTTVVAAGGTVDEAPSSAENPGGEEHEHVTPSAAVADGEGKGEVDESLFGGGDGGAGGGGAGSYEEDRARDEISRPEALPASTNPEVNGRVAGDEGTATATASQAEDVVHPLVETVIAENQAAGATAAVSTASEVNETAAGTESSAVTATVTPVQGITPVPANAAAATPVVTPAAVDPEVEAILEEKDHVSAQFVGRVIGKGGEMIRDLQARAGCRIDVDQNVPEGAPRVVTYRGTRAKIDFAKKLVAMLCREGTRDMELPLGEASQKSVVVPANVIGKIIGRGGEMIRELQNKSQAKIQVDHSGSVDVDPSMRKVTVTGTPLAVDKAQEMISFLTSNPACDAMMALGMLLEEKSSGRSRWGSGPPYPSMPNGGVGMTAGGGGYGQYGATGGQQYAAGGYSGYGQQQQYGGYQQQYGQQANVSAATGGYQQYGQAAAGGTSEVDVFSCAKMYMGRIIGSKGATINDLQKRSGCDIQINQDVPPGQDCQITIKGSRQGVDSVKQMLRDIIEMGPNHPYAGGQGGGQRYGGGYGQQGGGYGAQAVSGGYGGYAQQQQQQQQGGYGMAQQRQGGGGQYGQQQQAYAQSQPYAQQQAATGQQQVVYGGQQQSAYGTPQQQQYGAQQQQPQQGYQGQQQHFQQAGGQQYASSAAYAVTPQQQPAVAASSPWKTAQAADGQVYYYNEKTGESQWDKPAGM